MRRDYFELNIEDVDWVEDDGDPAKPRLVIAFDGPADELRNRLTAFGDDDFLDAKETDVAYRLQDSVDDPDATGVVGITNRVTGDFILELNEDVATINRFVQAAREYGNATDDADGRYCVEITFEGGPVITYDKRTFLVYDAEGSLLRGRSLIPSGVEL